MVGEKALVFDLEGSLAHFRAYYTNSSSISYAFPPRTALIGIIGAILGYERDTYYEILSPDNVRLSVSIINPIKKYIQSVNYIRTKPDEDNFNTFSNAVQSYLKQQINTYPVSVEFVVPDKDLIRYRIYFYSKNEEIYEKLKKYLKESKSYYPVYLGITELLADINYIGEFTIQKPNENKGVKSVLPENYFHKIDFNKPVSLVIEKMPYHFTLENNFRKTLCVKKYTYEKNRNEIPLIDYSQIYSINEENVTWME